MCIRVGLVAALLALGFASPQAAVSAEPVLSVHAETSGYATVDFARAVTLDREGWSLTGKGSYKVALLDRVVSDRRGQGYNLLFSDVTALQSQPLMLGGSDPDEPVVVPAGRYRVYVASDAPARFRIPTDGHASRTLHIKKKSPMQVRFDRGAAVPGGVPPHEASIRSDFALGHVVTYKFSKWTLPRPAGPFTRSIRDCITRRGGECPAEPGPGVVGVSASESEDTYSRHEYWDTFDYFFKGPATGVTQYTGTHRPTSSAQLLVAFQVG